MHQFSDVCLTVAHVSTKNPTFNHNSPNFKSNWPVIQSFHWKSSISNENICVSHIVALEIPCLQCSCLNNIGKQSHKSIFLSQLPYFWWSCPKFDGKHINFIINSINSSHKSQDLTCYTSNSPYLQSFKSDFPSFLVKFLWFQHFKGHYTSNSRTSHQIE